jgi:peptidyl-dipeptidase A
MSLATTAAPALALAAATFLATAAAGAPAPSPAPPGPPTAAEARKFVDQLDKDLRRLTIRSASADWVKNTYITDDTERLAAAANEELLGYISQAVLASRRFSAMKLDGDIQRKIHLLKVNAPVAAPIDPARRLELTTLAAKLEGMYGKAKACLRRPQAGGKCLDVEELNVLFRKSQDYDELLDAWQAWSVPARAMRPLYSRYVALANEGAKDIGFADTGALWRSSYDMSAEDFEKEAARLWEQVKPLYEELHCYVRAQLAKKYGADKVPAGKPIPAHLLGNIWAQEWANVYPLVEPYQGQPSLDVTQTLVAKKYGPVEMVKQGEKFFTSLGLDPLPKTFWERSMLTKPRDREVVCHASAWDVTLSNDLRIKMCIKPTEEDLITIHHELGHNYYFQAYYKLPVLYQNGANDGFHEAIGDALTLSITPSYLKQIGLLEQVPADDKGLINVQMKDALEKIAFLPFGKLIDEWRWGVYSGRIPPSKYNQAWWELRKKYQGIAPAGAARGETEFDPGNKYHIPANVPYTRYFLARLLQFQFHRAMCKAAGNKGPLHQCSIYGNREAGKKLNAMLALGASKPWPDALQVLTGERTIDATALIDYFAPLRGWLKEKNKGEKCGW